MKRFLGILAAATMLATLSAGSVLAAKPATGYTATIVANADCSLTLNVTWPRTANVDNVYGQWEQDDVHTVTTATPWPGGFSTFNAKRRTATMTIGTAETGVRHTWMVITQFYGANAQLQELRPTLTTSCGFSTSP